MEIEKEGMNNLRASNKLVTSVNAHQGTIYIEARIHDGIYCAKLRELQVDLEKRLSISVHSVEIWEDILTDKQGKVVLISTNVDFKRSGVVASDVLGDLFHKTCHFVQSLKAVEYVGPGIESSSFALNESCVKVQVYHMYSDELCIKEVEISHTDITSMPHVRFDGKWEALVFDHDLKSDLIWMMYNILHFSSIPSATITDKSPLILLHGPPGTGKTTLCQGLAQKAAIRLGNRYTETKLVEVRTATLLSKYFSESAKKVEEIFSLICRMCAEDPDTFLCVLIDEIESIASSRELVMRNGEVQDSMRATNALLTGLDRAKEYSNVVILCTSNFPDALDAAFLDRCNLQQAVDPPSIKSQYAILRCKLQDLTDREIIQPKVDFPSFDDAKMDLEAKVQSLGSKLLHIVGQAQDSHSPNLLRPKITGRALSQLPETAIWKHLRQDKCDADMALQYIEMQVVAGKKRGRHIESHQYNSSDSLVESTEKAAKRRRFTILLEEECDEDILQAIVTSLRASGTEHVRTFNANEQCIS